MGFLDRLFGADEAQARSDALDRQLQAENARDRDRYGEEWYAETQRNLNRPATVDSRPAYNQDVSAEISTAFDEGWEDGRENVSGVIGGAFRGVGGVVSSVLFGIPLWAWVLGAVIALTYFKQWGRVGKLLKK